MGSEGEGKRGRGGEGKRGRSRRDRQAGNECGGACDGARTLRGWRVQKKRARQAGGGVSAIRARGPNVAARAMKRGRDEGGECRRRELGGRDCGRRHQRDRRAGNESGGARDAARTRLEWRAQKTRARRTGGGISAIGARGTKVAAGVMERGRDEGGERRRRELGGRKEASARLARGERKWWRARYGART